MYALNIDKETNRILSACVVLPKGSYDSMLIVDKLPEGDVADYLYIDGVYVYEPLPKAEEPAEPITDAQHIEALEMAMAELAAEVYNG